MLLYEDVLIATDNLEAGKEMGRYILNYIEDTQIAIVSYVNTHLMQLKDKWSTEGLGKEAENSRSSLLWFGLWQGP